MLLHMICDVPGVNKYNLFLQGKTSGFTGKHWDCNYREIIKYFLKIKNYIGHMYFFIFKKNMKRMNMKRI